MAIAHRRGCTRKPTHQDVMPGLIRFTFESWAPIKYVSICQCAQVQDQYLRACDTVGRMRKLRPGSQKNSLERRGQAWFSQPKGFDAMNEPLRGAS